MYGVCNKGTLLGIPNRENIVGIESEYTDQGPYIPLYSCYILGVPYLGFPVESLYVNCLTRCIYAWEELRCVGFDLPHPKGPSTK